MTFERKDIVIEGFRAAYWEKGVDQAQTIVIIHGFPGNHSGLIDVARHLDGYHVILIDLPACGESEALATKHCIINYADWLNEFLRENKIEHPIIVGHSFGGRVAMQFAVKYPQAVERLILLMPVIAADGLVTKVGLNIAGVLPNSLRVKIAKSKTYQYFLSHLLIKSSNSTKRHELYDANMKEVSHLEPRAFTEISDEVLTKDISSLASQVAIPTLVVAGGSDEIATTKSLRKLTSKIPNSSWRLIPNTGHVLPFEEPEHVADLIKSWLTLSYTNHA
ncbi:MAG: alpha/beta hydrolase [Candidatus Paceibacterota bacterium]